MLPAFPERSSKFYFEPLMALTVVSLLILDCAGVPTYASRTVTDPIMQSVIVPGVWIACGIAAFCVLYILLGPSGEIERSVETFTPIPPDVQSRMYSANMDSLHGNVRNIPGLNGFTYCTRCFVWRPPGSHHCSTCQRCVTGFDHHCSFYGRCITSSNMPCFWLIFACLAVGMVAQVVTFYLGYLAPQQAQTQLIPQAPVQQSYTTLQPVYYADSAYR